MLTIFGYYLQQGRGNVPGSLQAGWAQGRQGRVPEGIPADGGHEAVACEDVCAEASMNIERLLLLLLGAWLRLGKRVSEKNY